MNRVLVALVALAILAIPATSASGDSAGAGPATASAEKKPKCKKGYTAKRKHGKWACTKVKSGAKFTPHPDLDVFGVAGTYVGSNGVTLTSSLTDTGGHQISLKVTFPSGYVSCGGRPPYPPVTITTPEMEVSDFGLFAGAGSSGGAYVQVQGHFTGPNTLVLDSIGASNVFVRGERCTAQYTGASVAF